MLCKQKKSLIQINYQKLKKKKKEKKRGKLCVYPKKKTKIKNKERE